MSTPTVRWCDRTLLRAPYFLLCTTEARYLEMCRQLDIPYPSPWLNPGAHATAHMLTHEGRDICIVTIDGKLAKSYSGIAIAALLVHEAVHVFQFLCRSIGEHSPSSEFEAYAIQNISEELMEAYSRETVP